MESQQKVALGIGIGLAGLLVLLMFACFVIFAFLLRKTPATNQPAVAPQAQESVQRCLGNQSTDGIRAKFEEKSGLKLTEKVNDSGVPYFAVNFNSDCTIFMIVGPKGCLYGVGLVLNCSNACSSEDITDMGVAVILVAAGIAWPNDQPTQDLFKRWMVDNMKQVGNGSRSFENSGSYKGVATTSSSTQRLPSPRSVWKFCKGETVETS